MYEMWSMIGFRDLTPHFEQASSWKKTSELANLHKWRLQSFRDRLSQVWPPENSEASKAYLAKLDELIKAVENVEKIAGENYKYSVEIPSAIAEAKRKLEPIMKKYQETESAQVNGTPTATPSPSPSGQRPADPQQGRIDEARRIMSTLSGDLVTAQYGLTKPAEYRPPKPVGLDEHTELGPLTPPVIPPVVPVMPTATPPSMPPPRSLTPMPMPVGPDLTGLTPPTTPTLPGPVPIGTLPVTPPVSLPIGPPGPLPPTGLISGLPPSVPTGLPGAKPVTGLVNGLGTNAVRGAMPPGGVIGGPAAGGRGGPAGLRANPVGGMIGSAPGAGRGPGVVGAGGVAGRGAGGVLAGGRGGVGAGGVHGAGAVGAGGRNGHHNDGDPDTEWTVEQGVAPVVDAPEAARPVDPGPAIGLSR
jgi:hypothetical protein